MTTQVSSTCRLKGGCLRCCAHPFSCSSSVRGKPLREAAVSVSHLFRFARLLHSDPGCTRTPLWGCDRRRCGRSVGGGSGGRSLFGRSMERLSTMPAGGGSLAPRPSVVLGMVDWLGRRRPPRPPSDVYGRRRRRRGAGPPLLLDRSLRLRPNFAAQRHLVRHSSLAPSPVISTSWRRTLFSRGRTDSGHRARSTLATDARWTAAEEDEVE